jgi:hypothetical protein
MFRGQVSIVSEGFAPPEAGRGRGKESSKVVPGRPPALAPFKLQAFGSRPFTQHFSSNYTKRFTVVRSLYAVR